MSYGARDLDRAAARLKQQAMEDLHNPSSTIATRGADVLRVLDALETKDQTLLSHPRSAPSPGSDLEPEYLRQRAMFPND